MGSAERAASPAQRRFVVPKGTGSTARLVSLSAARQGLTAVFSLSCGNDAPSPMRLISPARCRLRVRRGPPRCQRASAMAPAASRSRSRRDRIVAEMDGQLPGCAWKHPRSDRVARWTALGWCTFPVTSPAARRRHGNPRAPPLRGRDAGTTASPFQPTSTVLKPIQLPMILLSRAFFLVECGARR